MTFAADGAPADAPPPPRPVALPRTDLAVTNRARLSALHATGVLDAPADAVLDQLTRHAARVTGAPIAVVSLVEVHRQFLSSCVGLPEPYASVRETPIAQSICQYVVAAAAPIIIDDAREDPLWRDHPAVRELHVGAYLGAPIVGASGAVLGSFCVGDMVPHAWTAGDVRTVVDLAAAVSAALDLRAASSFLASREAELRDLLDHTSEPMLATDAKGRITTVNRAWCQALGYTADEATHLHPIDLVAPEDRARYRDAVFRLLKGESVRRFDVVLVTRQGRRVAHRCWAVPRMAPGPDGRPVCVGARVGYRAVTHD